MKLGSVACAALLLCAGCTWFETKDGDDTRGPLAHPEPALPPGPAPRIERSWDRPQQPPLVPRPPSEQAQPQFEEVRTEEQVEVPAPRDFSNELRALVGDPRSCVQAGAFTQSFRVHVDASVTATGVLSRANVAVTPDVPGVSTCLQARLNDARMRAPVQDAPRGVQCDIEVQWTPAQ